MKSKKKKDKQQYSLRNNAQLIEDATKDVAAREGNAEKEVDIIFNNREIESACEITLSYKEHIVFIVIGVVFSIILYLVSFLV